MLKRQGDILLEKITAIPEKITPRMVVEDNVIAKGEVTGHAHVLNGGTLYMQYGTMYAVVEDGGGQVVHDEHATLELEDGVWLVHNQTEYLSRDETVGVYD